MFLLGDIIQEVLVEYIFLTSRREHLPLEQIDLLQVWLYLQQVLPELLPQPARLKLKHLLPHLSSLDPGLCWTVYNCSHNLFRSLFRFVMGSLVDEQAYWLTDLDPLLLYIAVLLVLHVSYDRIISQRNARSLVLQALLPL